MKPLEKQFTGRGEVGGFSFKQIEENDHAYVYRVKSESTTWYEVFQKRENSQYNCISYPTSKAFGVWAWWQPTLEKAINKFNLITANSILKQSIPTP